ncbi:hypothetical protein AM493_03475 [Flavobacterium akiainvivens]|uniref:DUF4294 domain-containing protein n=2 Tax=Flavobacterium akiainvivens TaxID=1202724 RepID=A0A0N0RQH6_9FLAO|nr:DUF4294 domain-containing protein [Flavobacterium akiainvivens]KOS05199.1 hypothetical protein AM493_03475 [Flavobacterium akiainvivens]
MKSPLYLLFLLLFTLSAKAQVPETAQQDSLDNDSIVFREQLRTLVIGGADDEEAASADLKKQLALLQRRVLKVYPYAKVAADRLAMLDANMKKLKTKKEKKKYAKIVEDYLTNEFEAQLKKLTRKEGQILVKLIHRQTGITTYDLITERKSGWKAWWSQRMARLFSINLKTTYSPANVAEDFMIEGFLIKAFQEHKLVKQDAAFKIDYPALKEAWKKKQEAE